MAVDGSQVCHNIVVNTSYIYPYVNTEFLHSFLSLNSVRQVFKLFNRPHFPLRIFPKWIDRWIEKENEIERIIDRKRERERPINKNIPFYFALPLFYIEYRKGQTSVSPGVGRA